MPPEVVRDGQLSVGSGPRVHVLFGAALHSARAFGRGDGLGTVMSRTVAGVVHVVTAVRRADWLLIHILYGLWDVGDPGADGVQLHRQWQSRHRLCQRIVCFWCVGSG